MGRGFAGLHILFWMFLRVNGDESDDSLNSFITDVISKFKLTSPTILYHGEAPEICRKHWWVLCLDQENEQEISPGIKSKLRGKLYPKVYIKKGNNTER